METKNFEAFLNEDYTELEAPSEEVSAEAPAETEEVPTEEVPTEEAPADVSVSATIAAPAAELPASLPAPVGAPAAACANKALYIYGGVDSLNNQESSLLQAMNQLTTSLDCCEADVVKLYQLNIQPPSSDGAAEPADGMSFIYEKLECADVVVFVSPVQDGDVSSLTQTVLKRLASHYKNMELKNKIYAALLMGDQNSQQAVKADLANQANNLGLIVAPGTTIFDVAQIQTLTQAVKEIKDATSGIRSAAPVNTTVPGVLNFDQFSTNQGAATTDLAATAKVETDVEKGDSFDVVSDTDAPAEEAPVEGEEAVEEPADETETEETEAPAEGEEAVEEPADEEEGGELSEEEELSRRQKHLPKPLLKAILKSKHMTPAEAGLEEEEEIEAISAPQYEAKNENTSMNKITRIARFSDIKKDNTKNEFIVDVDKSKMSNSTINTGKVKTEKAPDQKEGKGGTTVSAEIQPKPETAKMNTSTADVNKGAKNLGTEENGEVKTAKAVKKSIENFADFSKKA